MYKYYYVESNRLMTIMKCIGPVTDDSLYQDQPPFSFTLVSKGGLNDDTLTYVVVYDNVKDDPNSDMGNAINQHLLKEFIDKVS